MEPRDFPALMYAVRSGNEDAARVVVQRFGQEVLFWVRRRLSRQLRLQGYCESSDFTQGVWATFFAHRDRLEAIESPEGLAAFLATIVRNKVANEARKQLETVKRRFPREALIKVDVHEQVNEPASNHASASKLAIAEETWQGLLERTSKHGREILRLRRNGLTLEEIAGQLGLNERTVRRVIERLKDD